MAMKRLSHSLADETNPKSKIQNLKSEMGLPFYEHTADVAGARRARRSFRFCVTASVLLAVMLWFSERYLRFELTESQYIAALTLPTESARAILRNVVKRDAAEHDSPAPKYLEALAEREEEDNVLPAYDKAYKLDPTDVFLVIRYGCALVRAGRYAEAQQRFREAGLLPTENALPKYLEAAAMAFSEPANGNLTASLALLAKANTGDNPVEFPMPLWSGELPARGVWYNKLRRRVADECCAPLYKYAELVLSQAKHQIGLRRVQYWDSWLSTLETMGQRLAVGNQIGAIQATAGIRIQLGAIEQREAIARIEPGGKDSEAAAALPARRQ
jgi:tetratricopeptide (TPR) repeat protein